MSIQWPATNYAEDIAQAVHRILGSAGTDALTVRKIARVAHVSPGTLANQFESREEMLARVASVVGRLLGEDLAVRDLGVDGVDRVCGMVAGDEYERTDLKVWFDLVALGRTSELIGARVRGTETRLQAVVARCFTESTPSTGSGSCGQRAWLALQGVWAHQLTPGMEVDLDEAQALVRLLVAQPLRS